MNGTYANVAEKRELVNSQFGIIDTRVNICLSIKHANNSLA